jgi:hypothetical protein
MALTTAESEFNTAAIAYFTKWIALVVDTNRTTEKLYLCPVTNMKSDGLGIATFDNTDGTSNSGLIATPARQHRIVYEPKRVEHADSVRYVIPNVGLAEAIGGLPIGFLCTNTAGLLT